MAKKPFDLLFKIVLLGEYGVERVHLMTRFTDNTYRDHYITGLGIDFKIKNVEVNGKKIKLQIWNPSGGERFHTIIHSYYRGAAGFMFIYDITEEETFDSIPKWLRNVREHVDEDVEMMLLGNKCDMEEERKISKERGEEFAKEHVDEDVEMMLLGNKCAMEEERMISKERGEEFAKENGMKFFETSAKENINVEEAFMTMTADILKKHPQKDTGSPGQLDTNVPSSRSHRCF